MQTLPYGWYVDPAVHRLEQERIFRDSWQYVGHSGELPDPGTYASARAADVPVLLVRDRDGELRAFLNVCRHRGAQLVEGAGRRATIQCEYHAWTYDLDGSLRRAPRAEHEAGFDARSLSLLPLRLGAWGPFLFVNPDPDASPLEETLGDLPRLVAEAGVDVDALVFHQRAEATYDANWKVCCENFLECYHCAVAHPGFSALIDVSPDAYVLETTATTFSSQYAPVRTGATSPFELRGEVPRGQFHFLWPNTTINIAPGRANLSIGPVLPDGPESASRFLDYFFAPDVEASWIEQMLAWDEQVGEEDRVLVERVQRGVRSGLLEHGRLISAEGLIRHFDELVTAALG